MTEQTRREQPRQQWREEQLSGEELEFRRHWRLMIDRLGGQKQAAETMEWSTSTVSRDCQGITLPSSNRLRELSNYLELTADARTELEVLLRRAREAQQARRENGSGLPEEALAPPPKAPSAKLARQRGGRHPHRRRIIAAAAGVVVAAAAVTVGVFASSSGKSPGTTSSTVSVGVQGTYKGQGIKPVPVQVGSLATLLRKQFHQSKTAKTMTGYEFRNALNPALCLTTADTGPLAGRNTDPVDLASCKLAANQIWIPLDWDINRNSYAHLVSAKYQTMCLDSEKIGDATSPGNPIRLFTCHYQTGNEAWDFAHWYQSVALGHQAYPLCLSNTVRPNTIRHCIDADKRPGPDVSAPVRLWTQQAAAGQFWS